MTRAGPSDKSNTRDANGAATPPPTSKSLPVTQGLTQIGKLDREMHARRHAHCLRRLTGVTMPCVALGHSRQAAQLLVELGLPRHVHKSHQNFDRAGAKLAASKMSVRVAPVVGTAPQPRFPHDWRHEDVHTLYLLHHSVQSGRSGGITWTTWTICCRPSRGKTRATATQSLHDNLFNSATHTPPHPEDRKFDPYTA